MSDDATGRPDDAIVDAVIGSTPNSDHLRDVLRELRALGTGPVPAASPELIAAMSDNVTSIGSTRARAVTAIGLGAVVAITLGVGSAAAAIPEFRDAAVTTFTTIVDTVTGGSDADSTNDETPAGNSSDSSTDGSSDTSETVTPDPTESNDPSGADNFPTPSNTHAPDSNPGKGTPGGGNGTSGGKSGSHPSGKPTANPSTDH